MGRPVAPNISESEKTVAAVISITLVLEHFASARLFFAAVSGCLAIGGLALVTNMHKEMGENGGATGFVARLEDGSEGHKARGSSFLYSVGDTVDAAKGEGLELVQVEGEDGVRERGVREEMLEVLGGRGRE